MSDILGSWIDGVPGTTVPADDRGLQYGDGLFETMLVRGGRVRFLEAHLARLALGCARLGIPFVVDTSLRVEILRTAAVAPDRAMLKIIVTRGSGPRGYAPRGQFGPRRVMTLLASSPAGGDCRRCRLAHRATDRRRKSGARGNQTSQPAGERAGRQEPQHEACFEALLLDAAGQISAAR